MLRKGETVPLHKVRVRTGVKTILAVDVSIADMEIYATLLGLRYDVIMADSGQAAMRLLKKCAVDLLIVGAELSDMTGMGFLAARKLLGAVSNIPAILVTGREIKGEVLSELAKSYGVKAVVKKLFPEDILLEKVESFLAPKTAAGVQ
jgi:response regulator RpfG family c-di-GMP phosphodiesterase